MHEGLGYAKSRVNWNDMAPFFLPRRIGYDFGFTAILRVNGHGVCCRKNSICRIFLPTFSF